ncbi:MAG: hypothetical protein KAJ55_16750 [Anaerolineales bacterium]|nr:hypothetical protein [Anaerolineales bacterium]
MEAKDLVRLKAKLFSKAKKEEEETFTKQEMLTAVEQFLAYGEEQFETTHEGYFSGRGWAARALRALQKQLDGSPTKL